VWHLPATTTLIYSFPVLSNEEQSQSVYNIIIFIQLNYIVRCLAIAIPLLLLSHHHGGFFTCQGVYDVNWFKIGHANVHRLLRIFLNGRITGGEVKDFSRENPSPGMDDNYSEISSHLLMPPNHPTPVNGSNPRHYCRMCALKRNIMNAFPTGKGREDGRKRKEYGSFFHFCWPISD
jgi:hypothetical protein